jgi:hypothetical protein
LVEGGGAHPAEGAQIGERLRLSGIGECGGDAFVDGLVRDGLGRVDDPVDDFEGERVGALDEFECERGNRRSGAVFDGQGYAIVAITPEIKVRVAPGVELG